MMENDWLYVSNAQYPAGWRVLCDLEFVSLMLICKGFIPQALARKVYKMSAQNRLEKGFTAKENLWEKRDFEY